MAIEVLLRRNIEGVGNVGDKVRVRPGYARNYLLPRAYAALVNAESMKGIEKDKAREEIRQAELAKERLATAQRLASVQITVEARAGDDGHLYGSVGARQILDALKKLGYAFEERHVQFEPVRELGEYEVPLLLAKDHTVKIKLWVVQDAQDAQSSAEEVKRAEAAKAAAATPAAGAPAADAPKSA